jgi:hypothetical protein
MPAELVQSLVELSNALNKHTMYPPGHPMLASAADNLFDQLNRILAQRSAIAFGITPTQIVAGSGASDPHHPVLRELAARLHRMNIGAIRIHQGVERQELIESLRYLSLDDRGRAGSPHRTAHVRLHPLSYSQLELVGAAGALDDSASWAAKLWRDLSHAALEDETAPDRAVDPAQVAEALDSHQWNDVYSQRIAESLTDLLEACRARGGTEAMALQSRISSVISSVAPETLERLVRLKKSEADRQRFLLEIAQSMAVDAVLDLVRAAAVATSRTISPALLQLLGKLAEYSEQGAPGVRDRADFAFRNQVRQLIEGWESWNDSNPAPAGYQRTMERLGLAGPSPLRGHSSTYECEPERVLMMSLEVGVANSSTYAAASYLISQGKTARLRDLFTRTPHAELPRDILRQVANVRMLKGLLRSEPLDMSGLDIITPLLGDMALVPLVDALADAESTEQRDQLLRLLHPFGEAAATEAWSRIDRVPWPAQRNLLVLLTRLPALPPGFTPEVFVAHAEPRIRTEALRILFKGAETRARAICEALSADDPATVRMGVFASLEECPPPAAPLLIRLLERGDAEPGVRASAVTAVASVLHPTVVDYLLGISFIKGTWFRRARIAGKSPVVLAALSGLARYWNHHARAREVLDLAAAHGDEEIRAAVERKSR